MKMSFQDPTVKVVSAPELQQSSPDASDKSSHNKKWICGIAGILVGLVIVVGTVILAVHFGGKTATEAIKEYQVSLQKNDGTKVTEKITTSETEEKYKADGSDFEVVYDTKNGFVVYKTGPTCFIRPLNTSEVATPDDYDDSDNGTTLSEGSSEEQYNETYSTTGNELKNRDLLHPMARKMCEGLPVMWLAKDREAGRQKRALRYCRRGYWIIRFPYLRPRRWVLVYGTICCQTRRYRRCVLLAGYRVIRRGFY